MNQAKQPEMKSQLKEQKHRILEHVSLSMTELMDLNVPSIHLG